MLLKSWLQRLSSRFRTARKPRTQRRSKSTSPQDLAAQLERLEARFMLSAIAWDGGLTATGTDWNTAANWVGDVLPGNVDDAQIGAGFTGITFASSTRTIRSLTTSSDVTMSGGSLTITDNSSFDAAVSVSGTGTMTLDTLTLSGIGSLTNAATINLNGTTINAALDNQGLLLATNTNTIAGSFTTNASSIIRVRSQANGFSSVLNVTNSFTNNGRVELLTGVGGGEAQNSTLNVTAGGATLTNAVGGVIQSVAGGNGVQVLDAQVTNLGTIDVGQSLNIDRASAQGIRS